MLNKAQVIGIAKACTVAFMKARISLVVWCREKKKNKVVPRRPYIKWTSWKGNDMLYYDVILLKVD